MSIKIVKGDMIESMLKGELDAYGQQCNCFCRMGRGIAPLLAKANPEVLEVDKATEEGNPYKLGKFSVTKDTTKPLVYNIYGQFHWSKFKVVDGRNTDYLALACALEAVYTDMYSKGIKSIGLPLIGCGLAGGDWSIVRDIIADVFEDTFIDVTIFVLEDKYLENTND